MPRVRTRVVSHCSCEADPWQAVIPLLHCNFTSGFNFPLSCRWTLPDHCHSQNLKALSASGPGFKGSFCLGTKQKVDQTAVVPTSADLQEKNYS